ncbi:MAG: hypothetical protein IJS47_03915 [Clostridia bacterium]|nr:hypothetical protein [Clostridia bacterium]
MFFCPFDKNFNPYDITKSTIFKPYKLNYGVRAVVKDNEVIQSFDPTCRQETICMLTKEERQYGMPQMILTDEDITEMLAYAANIFTMKKAVVPEMLTLGFRDGVKDLTEYGERNRFAEEDYYPVNYLVGYEIGVYMAVVHGDVKPLISSRPSRTKMLQELAKKANK